MGKTILTPRQHHFLELASKEEEITRWFYLTGGTALSEFYLHHRLSEDIDLFSFDQVNDRAIDNFLKQISSELQILEFKKNNIMGLYTFTLIFPEGETLKVDFNEFPFEQIEYNPVKFKNLKIDSYFDISVNKLYTILGRSRTRDYIDLFFILKKEEFSLEELIRRVEDKYSTSVDNDYLGSQFLRVTDLPKIYPKMLVPFDFEDMKRYFIKEAKRLGERSFR